MNIILKVALVCISGAMLTVFLRNNSKEFSVFISIGIGITVMLIMSPYLNEIMNSIKEFRNKFSELGDKMSLIFKAVAISVICEFAEQICIDSGERNIASKISFAGKTVILFLSLPEFFKLVNKIGGLMDNI